MYLRWVNFLSLCDECILCLSCVFFIYLCCFFALVTFTFFGLLFSFLLFSPPRVFRLVCASNWQLSNFFCALLCFALLFMVAYFFRSSFLGIWTFSSFDFSFARLFHVCDRILTTHTHIHLRRHKFRAFKTQKKKKKQRREKNVIHTLLSKKAKIRYRKLIVQKKSA